MEGDSSPSFKEEIVWTFVEKLVQGKCFTLIISINLLRNPMSLELLQFPFYGFKKMMSETLSNLSKMM